MFGQRYQDLCDDDLLGRSDDDVAGEIADEREAWERQQEEEAGLQAEFERENLERDLEDEAEEKIREQQEARDAYVWPLTQHWEDDR